METYVINLDRSIDRWSDFQAQNRDLQENCHRFSGIDGRTLDRQVLVSSGLIKPDLVYGPGALGNALSHLALWEKSVAEKRPLTICEDDVIFNNNFFPATEALVRELPPNWHVVYWGWNFDSVIQFELINGVSSCVGRFNQREMRQGIATFRVANVRPQLFRLMRAFGTVCYSVSPEGARLMKELCFPLQNMTIPIGALERVLENRSLDILLNSIFRRIGAYASFPPLAITPNDHSISTVEAFRP
jgi:glycosyl transferase, family 25